ncbi:MAG: NAD(P)H-binding protein [Chloroflexi bacterium]|nr:NAD(P)H-binding protein [Chloroflexota bacterium]
MKSSRGILVTGGATFLGDNIAAALLAEGSKVSMLVRPGGEDNLGPLAQQTRWSTADVWSPASLRGKARNHSAVIHTVGSLIADPARGLSFERLNFVSARNIANMCVSDGVERMILISGASAPWVSRDYIRSKRKAERFMFRVGLNAVVVRAPLIYMPGQKRQLFYRVVSALGMLPPLSLLFLGRVAPIPMDALASGVARIAMDESNCDPIYYARDLRRLVRRGADLSTPVRLDRHLSGTADDDSPFDNLDEELPFGWSPTDEPP